MGATFDSGVFRTPWTSLKCHESTQSPSFAKICLGVSKILWMREPVTHRHRNAQAQDRSNGAYY